MNDFQTCMCFVMAIVLTLPAVTRNDTPKELRLVAWITLCAAELMLSIFAVLIML